MTPRITLRALLTRHNACPSGKRLVKDLGLAEVEIDDTEAARAWAVAVAMGRPELRRVAGWGVGRLCRPESVGIRAGADLRGAILANANFGDARLDGAILDWASLVGAQLDWAILDGASLKGASLKGASLKGASLRGATLTEASLRGASLVGARLDGARFDDADLRGAVMSPELREYARAQGAIVDWGAP